MVEARRRRGVKFRRQNRRRNRSVDAGQAVVAGRFWTTGAIDCGLVGCRLADVRGAARNL
jgi:hypothetical protein